MNDMSLFGNLHEISESGPVPRPDSFIYGTDAEVLPIIFRVHAPNAVDVLDCTHNAGRMWQGAGRRPTVTMDIDPRHKTDVVGDFTAMPFEPNSFDVIVFDPPHLPTNAATEGSSKIWEDRYGITASGEGREGVNVSGMFLPFLTEAMRVLRPNGVVFAKLVDIVHNAQKQWHSLDFICAVKDAGLTPCDLLIKADPNAGNLKSSKWKNVRHFRNAHCFWFVARKGKCTVEHRSVA